MTMVHLSVSIVTYPTSSLNYFKLSLSLLCITYCYPSTNTANSKTVFIDLRSEDEVAQKKLESHDFIHAPITYTDTSKITSQAEKLIPDKGTPVVVYCGAGRRGKVGKEALIYAGYTNVVNGGGLEDILRHLQE